MFLLFIVVKEIISFLKFLDVLFLRLFFRVFLYFIIVVESLIIYGIFSRKC